MRPADLGFVMPAKALPTSDAGWRRPSVPRPGAPILEAARDDYARVAKTIGRFESITMVVDPAHEADARARCGATVKIVALPIDDSWLRDSGPTYVVDAQGRRAAACFTFNAWGGKYHPYDQDARVAARIAECTGDAAYKSRLVVEGGGFFRRRGDANHRGNLRLECEPQSRRHQIRGGGGTARDARGAQGHLGAGRRDGNRNDGHVDGYLAYIRPGACYSKRCAIPPIRDFRSWRRIAECWSRNGRQGRRFELVPIAEAPPR